MKHAKLAGVNPGLNTAVIRQVNVARVFHALRRRPGSSQRELSEQTGLDRATVNIVVRDLDSRGLVSRVNKAVPGRAGRPEAAIELSATAGVLLGGRLEPSGISLLATDLAGRVLGRRELRQRIAPSAVASVLENEVAALVAELSFAEADVRGLGLGVPALMSSGYLSFGPNLGWYDVPLAEQLSGVFSFPLYLDNDTKAAALAERSFGSVQESRAFVYLAGHSGVGGGLFLGGSLYRGAHGYAGEVGHMKLVPGGRRCRCGGQGCLEAYLSEAAVLEAFRAQHPNSQGLGAATLYDVAQLLDDPAVDRSALEPLITLLGVGVANLVCLLNPEQVVIGGALSLVVVKFRAQLEAAIAENLLPPLRGSYQLVFSPLAEAAVPMGGVALALEGFLALPDTLVAGALSH